MPVSSWSSSSPLAITTLAGVMLAFGVLASSCVRLSWQEGIACDGTSCPSGLGCCAGRCERECRIEPDGSSGDLVDAYADGSEDGPQDLAPSGDGEPSDGAVDGAAGDGAPPVDANEPGDGAAGDGSSGPGCPAEGVGCFFCTPGCSCITCGGVVSTCCLNQFQIATCGACP